jgi:hypothetical protein
MSNKQMYYPTPTDAKTRIASVRRQLMTTVAVSATALVLSVDVGTASSDPNDASASSANISERIARVREIFKDTTNATIARPAYIFERGDHLERLVQSTSPWSGAWSGNQP